jgi:hypothetical protein
MEVSGQLHPPATFPPSERKEPKILVAQYFSEDEIQAVVKRNN